MLESSLINMKIRRNILGGAKIPHSTSQPVIFCEDNKYYLAVFVFFYTREDIQSGMIERPAVWAIADMETGEIINEYKCREKDFSDADFEKKYNVRSDKKYDTSKAYYEATFSILDTVRSHLIVSGEIDRINYQEYLEKILANIPDDYQKFYRDLSI